MKNNKPCLSSRSKQICEIYPVPNVVFTHLKLLLRCLNEACHPPKKTKNKRTFQPMSALCSLLLQQAKVNIDPIFNLQSLSQLLDRAECGVTLSVWLWCDPDLSSCLLVSISHLHQTHTSLKALHYMREYGFSGNFQCYLSAYKLFSAALV